MLRMYTVPAVLAMETKSRKKSKFSGKEEDSVKIKTHNSTLPSLSSADVNGVSNPTVMTAIQEVNIE